MTGNLTSNTFNEAWIASVWKKLTKEIAYKTYNQYLPLTADDIASRAITYALKPGINETGDFPTSEMQLLRTARKIAKWAIIDAVKKANKLMESTDEKMADDDGIDQELSQHEVAYVLQQYRIEKNHKKIMAKGRMALSRLDCFLAGEGVSPRDIEIYKDWELYEKQTDDVCRRYKIKPSNLYKIVCIVNGILARKGRALVCE